MPSQSAAVEPALKRDTQGKVIRSFITDAAMQVKNGSLGPNALYDEFIRRNSSRDICAILAEYIPECSTHIQIQILTKLIARLCQHSLTGSIDSQLDLLHAIINKKLPYREYIHHIIAQFSRFSVLKAIFSRFNQSDSIVFGKLSKVLFAILEATTPMRVSIQLVLVFVKEQLESAEVKTEAEAIVVTELCASLFFRFIIRMQRAYDSFFIDEVARELTIVSTMEQEVKCNSLKSASSMRESIISRLRFFTTRLLQRRNCTTATIWADYLALCSCLCQALDKTVPQAHKILIVLLNLDETPDAISIMHEHLITLASRPKSLARYGLAYIEAICWSVRAQTVVCGYDYRLFALFSSAIDTLGSRLGNVSSINQSLHWTRSICFLLSALLELARIADSFKERIYTFLERKGASILESCLLPKSDYPGDVYIRLTSVFQELSLLFPEIIFNAFLLILNRKYEQTNLASTKTLLFIIFLSLHRFSSTKLQLLSKYVLLQLLQSLERLTLAAHQTDYGLFSLLHDVHQSIISVAKPVPGTLCMLTGECILPKFRQRLCSDEFAQYLGFLSIYARMLVEVRRFESTIAFDIDNLFERALFLTASQVQLLRPDTDVLQFSIVCELLIDVMSSVTFTHTQIRPLVSFLPTICAQLHESVTSAPMRADRRDASYLCAIYRVIGALSCQAHRCLSSTKLHSTLTDCMGPDILQCLRLVPDALESVIVRVLEQPAMDALVQASKVCSPYDLFRVLFSGEGSVSRSTRLILCRSAAVILLTTGVGAALPILLVQYGAIPDRAVKLSILRTIAYAFDKLSLTHAHTLPTTASTSDYEVSCTTYMALLEGTVGIASHALAERDGSMRLMGMRVTESMMLCCTPIQQGSPLLDHLVSMAFPNILDLCDRILSDAFQRLFEALYYRLGTAVASSFLFAGLFHVAHRVRQAYKLTYDSTRLYKGLAVDLFAPNMDELLSPVPACLQPVSTSRPPKPSVSVLEWTIGRKQHLDYDCAELFMRV